MALVDYDSDGGSDSESSVAAVPARAGDAGEDLDDSVAGLRRTRAEFERGTRHDDDDDDDDDDDVGVAGGGGRGSADDEDLELPAAKRGRSEADEPAGARLLAGGAASKRVLGTRYNAHALFELQRQRIESGGAAASGPASLHPPAPAPPATAAVDAGSSQRTDDGGLSARLGRSTLHDGSLGEAGGASGLRASPTRDMAAAGTVVSAGDDAAAGSSGDADGCSSGGLPRDAISAGSVVAAAASAPPSASATTSLGMAAYGGDVAAMWQMQLSMQSHAMAMWHMQMQAAAAAATAGSDMMPGAAPAYHPSTLASSAPAAGTGGVAAAIASASMDRRAMREMHAAGLLGSTSDAGGRGIAGDHGAGDWADEGSAMAVDGSESVPHPEGDGDPWAHLLPAAPSAYTAYGMRGGGESGEGEGGSGGSSFVDIRAADLRPAWTSESATAAAALSSAQRAARTAGVTTRVWSVEAGGVVSTRGASNTQKRKSQINFLAQQAQAATLREAAFAGRGLPGGGGGGGASFGGRGRR